MLHWLPILRRIYRKIVPSRIRQTSYAIKLKRLVLSRSLAHNIKYDLDYYANDIEPLAVQSARVMTESILSDLKPRTVIDVGCGTGALLHALKECGCKAVGLEYSDAALKYCRARGLEVLRFDLESDILEKHWTFDTAISLEVAEHLPEHTADRYIDLLACLSDTIVFTAAPPGQGGFDHVNEQPPLYWIHKFQARGFTHDEELSSRWRVSWENAGVSAKWYYRNLMIFRRTDPSRIGG